MWLMLNDCFLSIVHKDCARDELLVRARRAGDIEKVFPGAKVSRSTTTDYLFRAIVKRELVESAMVGEVRRINYENFKNSVTDRPLHDAYLRCWFAMSELQPTRPYSGQPRPPIQRDLDLLDDPAPTAEGYWSGIRANAPKKKRKKRRSIKRGR